LFVNLSKKQAKKKHLHAIIWSKVVVKLSPGCFKAVFLTSESNMFHIIVSLWSRSAFSTNTCAVATSKQDAEVAVAEGNHGDEARFSWTVKKQEQLTVLWQQQECFYDVSSSLKKAAVAKSCSSVDFTVVRSFHQVHDGK